MLPRSFYERDTVEVAKSLIGCRLIRRMDGQEAEVIITETEAYRGADDPASHAHRGPTPRSRIMFGLPGHLYVYFSYGMHVCANIVTEREGAPGAVLLRGAVPVSGIEWIRANRPGISEAEWLNGPGKLTKALRIGMDDNGLDLASPSASALFVLPGKPLPYQTTKRIGITKGTELPWRYVAALR